MTTPRRSNRPITGVTPGGSLPMLAVGLIALLAATAAGAATSPSSTASASDSTPVERAAIDPPSIESGDEDHFDADDAPPVQTPSVEVPAGLNDIEERSPWAGLWGPEIEPLAEYEPQSFCIPGARPAVAAFASLLDQAFPVSRNLGITRDCDAGRRSEHKEGRAHDWGVRVTDAAEREAAHQMIAWLLATDEHGNDHAMARRLGVMYVIWDGHIWSSSAPDDWRVYSGPNPHTDHVHVSFDWSGAMGRTSFWDAEGLAVGPGLFRTFSIGDLPSTFHLGDDRYRRELGTSPGEQTRWQEPGTVDDDEGSTDESPPPEPSEREPEEPEPAPATAEEPVFAPDGPAPLSTLPLPLPPLEIPEPTPPTSLTVPTVTTVPLIDDVVDGVVEDVDDVGDSLLGG